jgi:hypothetical protein
MAANDGAGARDDADRLRRRRRPMKANRSNLFCVLFFDRLQFCFLFFILFVVQKSFFFEGNKKIKKNERGKKKKKKKTHMRKIATENSPIK